jgi:hypothetical protein
VHNLVVTVVRRLQVPLEGVELNEARAAVRAALRSSARWSSLTETADGFTFTDSPRNPLVLETEMEVRLTRSSTMVAAVITARSQIAIQGDVFRMYPRLLRRVQRAIDAALASGTRDQEVAPATHRPTRDFGLARLVSTIVALDVITALLVAMIGPMSLALLVLVLGALLVAIAVDRSRRRGRHA